MLILQHSLILLLSAVAYADDPKWNGWSGNPIIEFCRRFGHATAVVDRKLYIDGGIVNYQNGDDLRNSTSTLHTNAYSVLDR